MFFSAGSCFKNKRKEKNRRGRRERRGRKNRGGCRGRKNRRGRGGRRGRKNHRGCGGHGGRKKPQRARRTQREYIGICISLRSLRPPRYYLYFSTLFASSVELFVFLCVLCVLRGTICISPRSLRPLRNYLYFSALSASSAVLFVFLCAFRGKLQAAIN